MSLWKGGLWLSQQGGPAGDSGSTDGGGMTLTTHQD